MKYDEKLGQYVPEPQMLTGHYYRTRSLVFGPVTKARAIEFGLACIRAKFRARRWRPFVRSKPS